MLTWNWLGRISIERAVAFQEQLFLQKKEGAGENFLLFCEHPSVYTYDSRDEVLRRWRKPYPPPAPVVDIPRRLGITYHGPGQIVCYCIVDLHSLGVRFPLAWNAIIDETVKNVLRHYGVYGRTRSKPRGASGIWVIGKDRKMRKICSRGVSILWPRGLTRFGFALNASTNLLFFDSIYPCGLDIQMTSISEETHACISLVEIAGQLAQTFGRILKTSCLRDPNLVPPVASKIIQG